MLLLFNPEDFGEEAAAALALYVKQQMDIAEAKRLQDKARSFYDVYEPKHSNNYSWTQHSDIQKWQKEILEDLKDNKYKEPHQYLPQMPIPKEESIPYIMYNNIEAIVDNYPSIRLKNTTNNALLMKDILIIAGRYEVKGFTNKTMIVNPIKKVLFIRELRTLCELRGMPLGLYDTKWISENWHFIKELIATRHTCPLPPNTNNTSFRYHAKTYTMVDTQRAQEYYDYQSRINI